MARLLDQIRLFGRIFQALQDQFPDAMLDVYYLPDDDAVITVPPAILNPAANLLAQEFDFHHLSAITGLDTGEELELLYHFWNRYGLTLRVRLPYDDACIPTLTARIPGAAFYEREVREMLGVTFEGLAVPGPMLLSDDWDEGPPLRVAGSNEAQEENQ